MYLNVNYIHEIYSVFQSFTEEYLEPRRRSMMELFNEKSERLIAYFRENVPS